MEFLGKLLILAASIATACSMSLSEENVFEVQDEKNDTNCSCDWRYLQHYEIKGCIVETTDSCGCPQKFTCPSNLTQQTTAKVCTYRNKDYKVGSKILSSDICQVCRCRNGVPPYISCISKDCPEINKKFGPNCHYIYQEDGCCPVDIECFENGTQATVNETCEYNGKLYPFGSKIYPEDDPCQICVCDEKWGNGDNSSCHQQDCMFEKYKSKLDSGCIPVYHESRCCPIEYYCPSSHNVSYSVLSSNESTNNSDISYEDQCTFAGQFYSLGEELIIGNQCVKCNCLVPPDFTCVHQACPPPPNEYCYVNYNPGDCCLTYECMLGDAETHPDGCPTPVCEHSGCRIEIPPGHECPTCVCDENDSELEHNNLEQEIQVQQVDQNIDQQFEHIQQAFDPVGISDEYSEDELQMMPLRMQDSEGQISVMEKMILPEIEIDDIDQYPDGLKDLEESSFEDNFSTEAVNNTEEIYKAKGENSTSQSELDLEDTYNNSVSNHSEKVQKRYAAIHSDQTEIQQKATFQHEINGGIEREGGVLDGKPTAFDDELENLRNRILDKNITINEIISINHVVKVPPGCPTPMCEGPWCRIGILPGEKCPTCICKRPTEP